MRIGRVVSSRSLVDVTCLVDSPGTSGLAPGGHAFGNFVRVGESAVGILYDSVLQNADSGNPGSRNNPAQAGAPPGTAGATMVSVLLLGTLDAAGGSQGMPLSVVSLHAEVGILGDDEIARFHRDADQVLQVRYVPLVLSHAGGAARPLLTVVLSRLATLFPRDLSRIEVLRKALLWQATMAAIR